MKKGMSILTGVLLGLWSVAAPTKGIVGGKHIQGSQETAWVNPYVTDGLVAMWDGEWNAGGGVHDANASGLKNLASDGVLDISLNDSYTITDNSVIFSGGYGIADKYDFTGKTGATISILASYKAIGLNANGWSFSGVQQRLAAYHDGGAWYLSTRYNPPKITDSYIVDTVYRYDFVWDVSNQIVAVYKNGALVGSATDNPDLGNPANHFRMMAYGSGSDTSLMTFSGNVFNCMVYAKALSAAEIAHNYAIDKERFGLP